MSGKLNEVISFLVGYVNAASCGANEGLVEIQTAARPCGRCFFDCPFNPREDELPRRATLAGGGLVEPAVKVTGKINGSSNRLRGHKSIVPQTT
jgi:hypothetical protein